MKINSINNNFTLKTGYLESNPDSHHAKEKCVGLCEENTRGYNVAFNGSLPIKSGAAVTSLKASTKKMKALNWLLEFAQEHNVAGSALMALFLAGALRPATIMALPGEKDKDDKIYAAGHSMASGLIGFAVSTAVTTPWDQAVKRVMGNYKEHYDVVINNLKNNKTDEPPKLKYNFKLLKNKYEKLVEIQKQALSPENLLAKRNCKKYIDTLQLEMKNITDWVIAVPRAMLTIALIPPILKYVFGLEKKKAAAPAPQEAAPAQSPIKTAATFMQKSISEFTSGGQK